MWQAALIVFCMFAAILGMLFFSLVAGLAAADRARVRVVRQRSGGFRR